MHGTSERRSVMETGPGGEASEEGGAIRGRRVGRRSPGSGGIAVVDDWLVVEEPLEIRVDGRPFTVTMRTPGQDFALARGLLFTEGMIHSSDDIARMRFCDTGEVGEENV